MNKRLRMLGRHTAEPRVSEPNVLVLYIEIATEKLKRHKSTDFFSFQQD